MIKLKIPQTLLKESKNKLVSESEIKQLYGLYKKYRKSFGQTLKLNKNLQNYGKKLVKKYKAGIRTPHSGIDGVVFETEQIERKMNGQVREFTDNIQRDFDYKPGFDGAHDIRGRGYKEK
jgi:hypothetical protein